MLKITKKIKHIDPKITSLTFCLDVASMDDFVKVCDLGTALLLEEKIIELKPAENLPLYVTSRKSLSIETKELSFQISNEDIERIADQLVSLIRNPITVAASLKDLDAELGKEMVQSNIEFSVDDLPEFIIAGQAHYIPGPPPQNYYPRKKQRLLNKILLLREQSDQINLEEDSPKFLGAVDNDLANQFVAAGHIFMEDKQVSRLLLHGSYTHRIMFEVIRSAIKNGRLCLKYGKSQELNLKQLLQLLVYTDYRYCSADTGYKYMYFESLWRLTIDTVRDSLGGKTLNPDSYSFSSCSPFVLNSLLLCFGKDLGLPNLQFYLLDSHYKAAYKMVHRIKTTAIAAKEIDDHKLYDYCMQALSVVGSPGDIGSSLPFTLPRCTANDHYTPFNSEFLLSGIVKKRKRFSTKIPYQSWLNFFDQLRERSNLLNAGNDERECASMVMGGQAPSSAS